MHPTLTDAQAARIARPAGALYILIILLGLSSEIGVRSAMIVAGDPVATAANLLAGETLFRASILADAAMASADVALALLLYWLLRPSGPLLAALATAFRLVQTAVIAANLLHQYAALRWLTGGLTDADAAATLAYAALDRHAAGYDLGLVFFGINSLLLGILLIRAPRFPRLIGQMMVAAGLVYLTGSTLRFLAPGMAEAFAPAYLVPIIAESTLAIRLATFGLALPRRRTQRPAAKLGG